MKILISRLLLIATILVAVGAARNWLAQLAVVTVVKSQTGLELSVRSTSFEPLQGSLRMEGIKIPMGQEFATVDSFDAVLNTNDFLKKLYRLESVEIRGIHYKADASDETRWFVPNEMWDRFKTRFPDWFTPNLDHDRTTLLTGKLDSETLALLRQQFESAQYAATMSEKWNRELQPLFQKTQTISQRIERIRSAVQGNNLNPSTLAVVLQDAGSLETDLRNVIAESQKLQNVAKNEALTLKQHLNSDVEKIRNLKPPKIDQQFVSEILIGPELNEQLATILAWVESVGVMMNEQTESKPSAWFDTKRLPGTDIVFESRKNLTEYCIKRAEFDGDLTFGNAPVYFVGRMFDLASPAANGEEATTIQLCLDSVPLPQDRDELFPGTAGILPAFEQSGSLQSQGRIQGRIYITAILDRRSNVPCEKYLIACPNMELPGRVLGREDNLAFSVSPGVSQFYAVIDRVGENLDGRIRFSQSMIRMTPTLPPQMRGSELDAMLTSIARGIDRIDAELTVTGTVENPQIRVQSDLGERFAASLEPVLLGKWNDSRLLLANELNGKTNDALKQVGGLFSEQLDPLLNQLNLAQSQLTGGNPNTSVQQVVQSLLSGDSQSTKQQLQQQGTQLLNNTIQKMRNEK
ncbi:MAG: hypothetical protein FWC43_02635 [Planctomycetaceae bacterium]|nr:hypothetical protein [Planctomycetaceae bacterium]